jgi:hypothetical protein
MIASAMKEPCVSPGARITDLDGLFVLQTLMSNERAPQLYFFRPDIIVPGIMGLASGEIPALISSSRCKAVTFPSDLKPTE